MDEHSMSSYVWLCEQTIAARSAAPRPPRARCTRAPSGSRPAPATWCVAAWAIVGGITPLLKIAHLAESFGMHMEVHGGGVGNLHVLVRDGQPGPVLRARPAPPVHRLRRGAALAEQADRPDGRRGLRAHLARTLAWATTSTSTTSAQRRVTYQRPATWTDSSTLDACGAGFEVQG